MGKRHCGRTVTAVVLLLSGLSLLPAAGAPGIPGTEPAIAASLYPNPARPETLWRLVWSDEFNGPPCNPSDPARCSAKDWQKTAQCYGTPEEPVAAVTPFAFHVDPDDARQWTTRHYPHLANLDKCTWLVSDHVNKIHFQGPAGPITRYNPANVTVSNGEMRITTRRAHPKAVDCGRVISPNGPNNEANLTKACPYEAGNVFSYGMRGLAAVNGTQGTQPGDGHVFRGGGRIEVRARIPATRGNMAAFWTWQQDWRAPEREYDLLENWVNWHAMSAHSLQGPGTFARHVYRDEYRYTLSKEFHVYSMEWKKDDSFSYYLDNRHLVTWKDSTRPGGHRIRKDDGTCVENRIFGNPFYLIFWNLIAEYDWAQEAAPLADGQRPDTLYIDYIRYYERCDDASDASCVESTLHRDCPNPCGGFGFFDGFNCYVGPPPAGRTATLANGQYAYKAAWKFFRYSCPSGGTLKGSNCLLGGPPTGRIPFVWSNAYYTAPLCTTTAQANCANPCPWKGTVYDARARACRVDEAASATPAGVKAFFIRGVSYYEPQRCPYGGTYDAAAGACVLVELPGGAEAFVWESGLYYKPPSAGQCPYGGFYDSVNCWLQGIPDGAQPYAVANRILTPALCGPATDWQNLQQAAGEVSVENLCGP
jgi:beta-glucanase (GH16 family)